MREARQEGQAEEGEAGQKGTPEERKDRIKGKEKAKGEARQEGQEAEAEEGLLRELGAERALDAPRAYCLLHPCVCVLCVLCDSQRGNGSNVVLTFFLTSFRCIFILSSIHESVYYYHFYMFSDYIFYIIFNSK